MEDMEDRVMSGLRTTGSLHLGHYFGALQNWLKLQRENECFFLLADLQALSTHFDNVDLIEKSVFDVTVDLLSVGIDPNVATIFVQSQVPELTELTMYFTMITKLSEMERNPTIKSELSSLAENKGRNDVYLGFINYPVSQAADILLFSQSPFNAGNLIIPVGQDQAPHIEFSRQIARRFNKLYGKVLTVPSVLISENQTIKGLDMNSKMSKSLNNAIFLSDTKEEVSNKIKTAFTDPNKIHKNSPGNPEGCAVFEYHKIFSPKKVSDIKCQCISGELGCFDDKQLLAKTINDFLEPFRQNRAKILEKPAYVWDILRQGTLNARNIGKETLRGVKDVMHISYKLIEV